MNTEKKNLLVFGYGLTMILGYLLYRYQSSLGWSWNARSLVLVLVVFCLAVVTSVRVYALRPIYSRWMKVALLIGHVVNLIILIFLFYIIFAPVGIVLKILKKDFLDRAIDSGSDTYWTQRPETPFNPKNYTRQF